MIGHDTRVLISAFAAVPSSNPHSAGVLSLAAALRGFVEIVTVKTDLLPHAERLGRARMFRVPVGVSHPAEQHEKYCRALCRMVESEAYDVVHVRCPREAVTVGARKAELGYRLVYEVASFADESWGPGTEADWDADHTQALQLADLVIVPTEAATRAFQEQGVRAKVGVIAPGVDIDAFDAADPRQARDTFRVLYLGSFGPDRDLATLLEAVRRVSREKRLRVLLAGESDPRRRGRLRAMTQAFGIQEVVEIRGEPPGDLLPSLIEAADLCVVPAAATPRFQEHGDLPEPLLEYLACRRPVIASGVPGIAEVLRDEQEAFLYPPGDDAALADALTTLMQDPALRRRLAETAYARVRANFSLHARRRRLAEIYETLLPGSQEHDPWEWALQDELASQGERSQSSVSALSRFERSDTVRTPQRDEETPSIHISFREPTDPRSDTSPDVSRPR